MALVLRRVGGSAVTAHQLYGLLRLRSEVFVVEQNCVYPDLDGRDLEPTTRHLWWEDEERIASCLRVVEEIVAESAPPVARIGRVATVASMRGQGLARLLMEAALADLGAVPSVLAAQLDVVPFYETFGYQQDGPEFLDHGLLHLPMRRA